MRQHHVSIYSTLSDSLDLSYPVLSNIPAWQKHHSYTSKKCTHATFSVQSCNQLYILLCSLGSALPALPLSSSIRKTRFTPPCTYSPPLSPDTVSQQPRSDPVLNLHLRIQIEEGTGLFWACWVSLYCDLRTSKSTFNEIGRYIRKHKDSGPKLSETLVISY